MRILIVEDEHRIANTIKKGLEMERFAVDAIYTGTEGYDLASTEEYDLVILDRMLPGLDGIEICRRLRQEKIHIPIIMLTAKSEVVDRVEGLNAGADDYLPKPFAFTELLARIRALLRRPKKALPDLLSFQDLKLDPTSYSVMRNGLEVKLSHKEFSLLEYLLRHKGQTVTKEQIISHVWDYDADILPNTVEVTLKNLRSKIEAPFPKSPSLINTVRGFGYRIG
jgi:DNA-binding response OmpR family regulator